MCRQRISVPLPVIVMLVVLLGVSCSRNATSIPAGSMVEKRLRVTVDLTIPLALTGPITGAVWSEDGDLLWIALGRRGNALINTASGEVHWITSWRDVSTQNAEATLHAGFTCVGGKRYCVLAQVVPRPESLAEWVARMRVPYDGPLQCVVSVFDTSWPPKKVTSQVWADVESPRFAFAGAQPTGDAKVVRDIAPWIRERVIPLPDGHTVRVWANMYGTDMAPSSRRRELLVYTEGAMKCYCVKSGRMLWTIPVEVSAERGFVSQPFHEGVLCPMKGGVAYLYRDNARNKMKVIVRDIRNGDATELELPWESKEVILTHGPEDKLALVTNQGLIFLWSVAAERMWERIDITSYGKGGGVPVWSKTEYWLYDDPGIYFCAGTGRFALIDDAGSLVIGHVSRGEE